MFMAFTTGPTLFWRMKYTLSFNASLSRLRGVSAIRRVLEIKEVTTSVNHANGKMNILFE